MLNWSIVSTMKYKLFTLIVILLFIPAGFFFQSCQKQVQSTYTLGSSKAPVHITLFQEFACPACKDFENEVAPRIIKTYVNTGKAQLTFVPTAFLDQSRNAFIHACSLLNDKPLRFLPFMHAYFQTSRADMTDEQFSKKYPQIKILSSAKASAAIAKNNRSLEKFYDSDLRVPSVLISDNWISSMSCLNAYLVLLPCF